MTIPVSIATLELWKRQGLSDAKIGDRFGVHRSTVRQWRLKNGVDASGSGSADAYCECGRKARHALKLDYGSSTGYVYTDTFRLCDRCYRLETEVPERVYVPRHGLMVGSKV